MITTMTLSNLFPMPIRQPRRLVFLLVGGHTLHDAPQSIENGARGEVLRGDEVDEVLLPPLLLLGAGGNDSQHASSLHINDMRGWAPFG